VGEPRTHQPERASNLQNPIMLLTGHEGEIYGARFNSDGQLLASVGYDMKICENFLLFGWVSHYLPIRTLLF
jgi:hypothetical protein